MTTRKGKRVKLRRGDLIEITLTDGRLAYGLVVIPGEVFYLAVFQGAYTNRPTLEVLSASDIALVGTTMDSEIYHDRWQVIAHERPIPSNVPYPNWKVQIGGELRTTDFEGAVHWPIRPNEVNLLDLKWSRSASAFQDVVEALNGLGEWEAGYDKLTVTYAAQRMTRAQKYAPTNLY